VAYGSKAAAAGWAAGAAAGGIGGWAGPLPCALVLCFLGAGGVGGGKVSRGALLLADCNVGAAFACADVVVVQRKEGERGGKKKRKEKKEC